MTAELSRPRITLTAISSRAYEHPADRGALTRRPPRAHKEVLFFASPFFEAALSGDWAETGRPQSVSSVITYERSSLHPPKTASAQSAIARFCMPSAIASSTSGQATEPTCKRLRHASLSAQSNSTRPQYVCARCVLELFTVLHMFSPQGPPQKGLVPPIQLKVL